jgi:hypothetical protein
VTVTVLQTGTLGNINVGLAAMLPLLNPMLAQFDANLFGAFGLGSLLAGLQAQYSAALAAQLNLSLQISDPRAPLLLAIQAAYQIQASLSAALALPSISLSANLTASLSLIASLQFQLGGIKAAIALSLKLKIPLIALMGQLQAALDAGPFGAWYMTGECSTVAGELKSLMQSGIGDPPLPAPIAPTDTVWGVLLLTKAPAAKVGLDILFGTPPLPPEHFTIEAP